MGGGPTWMTGTYDAETDTLFWATGNPGADYDGTARLGDNLYTCSVLALDPATGKIKWYFQFTPHDVHDWDATETPVLIDAQFRGRPRKLLIQANRNAFFYILDRETGEFLLGKPFAHQTWAKGIDEKGRPIVLPNTDPTPKGIYVCPDATGATNWAAPSYDPATGLFFVPVREGCANLHPRNHHARKPAIPSPAAIRRKTTNAARRDQSAPSTRSPEIFAGTFPCTSDPRPLACSAQQAACCSPRTPKAAWWRSTPAPARSFGAIKPAAKSTAHRYRMRWTENSTWPSQVIRRCLCSGCREFAAAWPYRFIIMMEPVTLKRLSFLLDVSSFFRWLKSTDAAAEGAVDRGKMRRTLGSQTMQIFSLK